MFILKMHTNINARTHPYTKRPFFPHWFVRLLSLFATFFLCLFAKCQCSGLVWFYQWLPFFVPRILIVLPCVNFIRNNTHTHIARRQWFRKALFCCMLVNKKWSLTHFGSLEHVEVFKCYFEMRIAELTCLYAQMHT